METVDAVALHDVKIRVSDLKRKRAARCAAYFMGAARSKVARISEKKSASNCCDRSCRCCAEKSVVSDYANFLKSGVPQRLMFFSGGDWDDFPANVTASLIEAFRARKSATEILMQGCIYLVDFLHMVLINLKTGLRQSVAWIDESNRCFFPKFFFDRDDMPHCLGCDVGGNGRHNKLKVNDAREIEVKLEIEVSEADSSKPEDPSEVSVSHVKTLKVQQSPPSPNACSELEQDSDANNQRAQIKEVIAENGVCAPAMGGLRSPCHSTHHDGAESLGFESLHDKLVRLESGDNDYLAVQNAFLTGFGTFLSTSNTMGIYRYLPTSSSAKARLQSFEKQIEITKRHRGDANVQRAWHGSSREGICGIILHGFGKIVKPSIGESYGTGIYLSPEDSSHVSVKYSDVDENGVQHMVLCRIISGNMEQVQPGSEQFHPSSENFDSGVDDIQNPKHYIIWSTHMNTHIYPEYVVSFKVPPSVREYLTGLKDSQNTVDVAAATNPSQHESQLKRSSSNFYSCKNSQTVNPRSLPLSSWWLSKRMLPLVEVRDGKLFVHSVKPPPENIHGNAPRAVKLPTSAWMSFPMLLAAIEKSIDPLDKLVLDRHYDDFKMKKITREEFIKWLRLIIGDKLLISTLKSLQGNSPLNSPVGPNAPA